MSSGLWKALLCGAAVFALACGGSSNPNSPSQAANAAPTIGSMTVTPSFGVSQATPLSLSSSASDPDGDSLSYRWDYPGGSLNAPGGTAVMNGDGNMTVTLTVTDSRGLSATSTRTVTLGTMAGRWAGENHCGRFEFTFTQTNAVVTGTGRTLQPWCAVQVGVVMLTDPGEPGRIRPDGSVEIRYKVGNFIDAYMRGQMDTTGRKVTGGMFNSGFTGQPFTLTKQ